MMLYTLSATPDDCRAGVTTLEKRDKMIGQIEEKYKHDRKAIIIRKVLSNVFQPFNTVNSSFLE